MCFPIYTETDQNVFLRKGDAKTELLTLNDNSIDSLLTDPPAGINFMGKDWDNYGSLDNFQNEIKIIFQECFRVMKPGAHGLVWAIPRTSHHTAMALERCGFEIRDVITHLFGSGFPKSLNVSKAIDKATGAEREVIGKPYITASVTEEAKQWDGWGTALKPASEHWILIRKPLSEKTVAENVLKWGTGAINIDGTRIKMQEGDTSSSLRPCRIRRDKSEKSDSIFGQENDSYKNNVEGAQIGRFPANLVLDEEAAKALDEQTGDLGKSAGGNSTNIGKNISFQTDYSCSNKKGKPCGFGDSGGASRFFYVAKVSTPERNAGLEELKNAHPTVKPIKLMSYFARLITPPNGIILDPFMGSGSIGIAAIRDGFRFIGIEKEEDYFKIAEKRINHTLNIH